MLMKAALSDGIGDLLPDSSQDAIERAMNETVSAKTVAAEILIQEAIGLIRTHFLRVRCNEVGDSTSITSVLKCAEKSCFQSNLASLRSNRSEFDVPQTYAFGSRKLVSAHCALHRQVGKHSR
ncbi:hypothetical protein V7S43_007247 [Phytophthora oleae]|uniref:PPM-type phosphatase domain-containing protein n=1 Tax=Phytophthora oleae TaxID=2107226 RepID=A0ABD3FMZ0_9STRA